LPIRGPYVSREETTVTIVNSKALEEKLRQAATVVSEPILTSVRTFLADARDAELVAINPYRFAAPRKLDRLRTLKAFLHLTERGLFNLSWIVHCPSCKGWTQHAASLSSLKHESRCELCLVDFAAGFDRSVELCFGVNPAVIRPAEVDPFEAVMAGIDLEPGIRVELDPGESHFLRVELAPGNYLLGAPEDKKAFNIVVMGAPAAVAQKLTLRYGDDLGPLTIIRATPGPADIVIENRASRPRELLWAHMAPMDWPSAARVASLQEFRNLFSSEMLSPDESFSIESQGFLFTDIKGSTELYERMGDAQAFALVKEHFRIMERIVAENGGGIVKTIGDAVMAVFADPRAALRTSVEMIEAFDDLETARRLKNAIVIKVGVHYGPCIAVTLNDRLDYFGTTVNIAARVQGLSDGRDIMASEAVFAQGDGVDYLRQRSWNGDAFVTSLKGLKASYQVHRIYRPRPQEIETPARR
jgi:class 3 adenylate cyclase